MEQKIVKAKICWVSEGKYLPQKRIYSTVARFEDIRDRYPDEAWSIVAELDSLPDESLCSIANIRFLVEWGPEQLLYKGSKFDLFEGKRLVANGEVIE